MLEIEACIIVEWLGVLNKPVCFHDRNYLLFACGKRAFFILDLFVSPVQFSSIQCNSVQFSAVSCSSRPMQSIWHYSSPKVTLCVWEIRGMSLRLWLKINQTFSGYLLSEITQIDDFSENPNSLSNKQINHFLILNQMLTFDIQNFQ